jgi:hypothetical protein
VRGPTVFAGYYNDEERTGLVAMRRRPGAISLDNSAAGGEPAQHLGITRRRDSRRHLRQLRYRVISQLQRPSHGR